MILKGTDDEKNMRQFDATLAIFVTSMDKVLAMADKGDLDGATALTLGSNRDDYNAADGVLTKNIEFNATAGKAEADIGAAVYDSTRYVVFGAIVLAFLISAALGFGLIRSVSKPVKAMTGVMGRLADHDLSVAVTGLDRKDEIGAMASAVQVFKSNMIKADELAATQKAEQAAKEERAKRVNTLTAEFDASIGNVVQTVSAQSTQLESSGPVSVRNRGRGHQAIGHGRRRFRTGLRQCADGRLGHGRAQFLHRRDQPSGWRSPAASPPAR